MIATNNKAKTIGKIFHVILNAKLIVQYEIQIKNPQKCQYECKNYRTC